jgi:hypothetical protein
MNKTDCANRRIDVLAIGLFGLAVGALTVGLAQVGRIPDVDKGRRLSDRARVWRPRAGARGYHRHSLQ